MNSYAYFVQSYEHRTGNASVSPKFAVSRRFNRSTGKSSTNRAKSLHGPNNGLVRRLAIYARKPDVSGQ